MVNLEFLWVVFYLLVFVVMGIEEITLEYTYIGLLEVFFHYH
jgi:hypothetical protein